MSKLLVDGTYAINIVKLKEIAEKKTTKNIYGLVTETFTNSAENGIISQSDFFDRTITNDKNISGYFIVEPDDFVYNPRISTFAPVGPINRNKLGRSGVMSPLYLVFHTHDVEPEYLEWYFKSNAWHQFMRDNGNTGARSDRFSISDAEFFNMPIPIPPVKVQKAIAKTLTTLDTKVILEKNEVEKFQNLKSAMLTKMFPKKDGNVPEIRFDGFTDVWEQRKFGEIVDKYEDPVETPHDGYYRLGIRSHAKGTFHSYVEKGHELETAQMYRVAAGNFIVNITFGWEHAVAITNESDAGKLVSHRFPQYSFHDDMLPEFFKYVIADEDFRHWLWLASPGGAGRNRVLKLDEMLNYEMVLPSKEEQQRIAAIFRNLDTLITLHQRKYEKLIDTKKAFLEKLIGGEK